MNDRNTKTAPWTWPTETYGSSTNTVRIGARDMKRIRGLVAMWDVAETGAPGLVDANGESFEEDEEFKEIVTLFLEAAQLSEDVSAIKSPYLNTDGSVRSDLTPYLEEVPTPTVVNDLLSTTEVSFVPDQKILQVWEASLKTGSGIDPKRTFGSTNINKDLRELIDTVGALSSAEFKKQKAETLSRLVLFLQLFVQQAELPLGTYSYQNGAWTNAQDKGPNRSAVMLGRDSWVDMIGYNMWLASDRFELVYDALMTLGHEGLLAKSGYHDVAKQFLLGSLYGRDHGGYGADLHTQLAVARTHFLEQTGDPEQSPFSLYSARIHNAAGDYKEAMKVLKEAGLNQTYESCKNRWFDDSKEITKADQPSVQTESALFEQLIAGYGSGAYTEEAFDALLWELDASAQAESLELNVLALWKQWGDATAREDILGKLGADRPHLVAIAGQLRFMTQFEA